MTSEITYSFRAHLTLLPTKNGGRKKSVFSGYRPSFVFNSQKQYCGEIELIEKEELKPGETSLIQVNLLPARTIRKNLHVDTPFTIVEGNKTVGRGLIVQEILKKETVS